MDEIRQRLLELASARGMSLAELSKKIGRNHSYLQQFVKYEKPRKLPEDERRAIAVILGIDDSLLKPSFIPTKPHATPQDALPAPTKFPTFGHWPKDVPVYGTGVGGSDGDFSLNGEIIDYVRRPPGLAAARDAFALYLVGSSMSPWKEPGDLIFVRTGRQPSIGDYVVVQLKSRVEGDAGICLVKRLVARDSRRIRLQQYSPPDDKIEILLDQIAAIYRVVPLEELVGA